MQDDPHIVHQVRNFVKVHFTVNILGGGPISYNIYITISYRKMNYFLNALPSDDSVQYRPIRGQYSFIKPIIGQYSFIKPIGGQYSFIKPIRGQYSFIKPIRGQYSFIKPIRGQYSFIKPIRGQYSLIKYKSWT